MSYGKELIKNFKLEFPLKTRQEKVSEIKRNNKEKYNRDVFPVVAFPAEKDTPFAKIVEIILNEKGEEKKVEKMRSKFIIENDKTFSKFMLGLRKHIKIGDEDALHFMTPDGIMITGSALCCTIYERYKDEDGFLYILYCKERTFGHENQV